MVLTVKGLKYHIEFAARMNSLFCFSPLSLGGTMKVLVTRVIAKTSCFYMTKKVFSYVSLDQLYLEHTDSIYNTTRI